MKKFIWCERSSNKVTPVKGPNKNEWKKLIGHNYIHNLEDLLKLPITEILKYRIESATEGVIIGLHQLQPNVDLAVRRLSDNEMATMQLEKSLAANLTSVSKQIEEKLPALCKQRKDIEVELNATRQKIKEMNLEGVEQ